MNRRTLVRQRERLKCSRVRSLCHLFCGNLAYLELQKTGSYRRIQRQRNEARQHQRHHSQRYQPGDVQRQQQLMPTWSAQATQAQLCRMPPSLPMVTTNPRKPLRISRHLCANRFKCPQKILGRETMFCVTSVHFATKRGHTHGHG